MMANDKDRQLDIERARELLSPYLDNEVTDEERVLVEQVVATSAELGRELETLRQTISLVGALPQMPAPRPFTLSEAGLQPAVPAARRYFTLPSWVRGWAMLAATLLCVLAIGGLFLSRQFSRLSSPAPAAEIALQPESTAPQAAEEKAVEEALTELAAEEAPTEPAVAEEEAARAVGQAPAELAAEEAPAEPTANKEEADLVELEVELEAEEEAEGRDSFADEATAAQENQPVINGEAARSAAPESDDSAAGAIVPAPTPPPPAAAPAAPTAEAIQEKAAAEVEAPGAAAAESEPPRDLDQAEQEQAPSLEPTATSTPPPSPTVVARVTTIAPATPQTSAAPGEGAFESVRIGLAVTGIALLGALIIVGVAAWLIIKKPRG